MNLHIKKFVDILQFYTIKEGIAIYFEEEKNMKIMGKCGLGALLACILLVVMGVSVQANEEQFTAGTVWGVVSDTEVKETADDSARTVGELEEGAAVILAEDTADGWCKIQNQSVTGYIPIEALQIYQAGEPEELTQEFTEQEQLSTTGVEDYEQIAKEKKTATIWGVIIGVIVVAIFAVGIISALKNNKE